MKAKTVVDARKIKIGPKEALALLDKVDTVYAARGKKVVTFDLALDRPGNDDLLEHLIGRSGSLRAPAAIIGKTLIAGFNPELYEQVLDI